LANRRRSPETIDGGIAVSLGDFIERASYRILCRITTPPRS
jgi:hypothetical protein